MSITEHKIHINGISDFKGFLTEKWDFIAQHCSNMGKGAQKNESSILESTQNLVAHAFAYHCEHFVWLLFGTYEEHRLYNAVLHPGANAH